MLPLLLLAQTPFGDPPALSPVQERVYAVAAHPGAWNPVELARRALGPMDLTLRLEQPPSLAAPRRVLLERRLGGFPVADELVRVNLLADGSTLVVAALTDLTDFLDAPLWPRAAAQARAAAAFGAAPAPQVHAARLEVLPLAAGARLAWRVDLTSAVSTSTGASYWIDARDGALLGVRDRVRHSDGTAAVFDPNPVQTGNDATLRDQGDSPVSVPQAEYRAVVLRDLDGSGYVTGLWATTDATPRREFRANLDFTSARQDEAFEEVMVYYHTDVWQRYLQSLGLRANDERQRYNVRDRFFGIEYANASYNELTEVISLGTQNVDMGEDADVTLHEYGHAIHDEVQGGIGSFNQNGGMSEGYGDFYACVWFDDVALGDWVSTNPSLNSGGPWPNVRRADNTEHYPEDLGGEVHEMGEVWCGALWELYLMVGRDTAIILATEGMALQTTATNMPSGAQFLHSVDQQLYGGAHAAYIEGAMRVRGIRDTPPDQAFLTADDRSPLPGQVVTLTLESPADPGAAYVVVLSQVAAPTATGAPYHTTLAIGTEWLGLSGRVPGLMSTLDATGRASIPLRAPSGAAYKTLAYAQAMILDAGGAARRLSAPMPFRVERH